MGVTALTRTEEGVELDVAVGEVPDAMPLADIVATVLDVPELPTDSVCVVAMGATLDSPMELLLRSTTVSEVAPLGVGTADGETTAQ